VTKMRERFERVKRAGDFAIENHMSKGVDRREFLLGAAAASIALATAQNLDASIGAAGTNAKNGKARLLVIR
jgi:hypothetical protein